MDLMLMQKYDHEFSRYFRLWREFLKLKLLMTEMEWMIRD